MFDPDQITIWCISLKVTDSELDFLEGLLADDEKIRSDRYKFDLHRRRFIVARANLRIILSKYLNLDPQDLNFTYSSKGKPSIATNQQNPDQSLEFNLSHSEDLAVCAVTWNSVVGIDLEYQKPINHIQSLSERFFTQAESQIIQASEYSDQAKFLKIWTLKEAYLKATGEGLGKLSEVSTIWEQGEITRLAVNEIPLDWTIYQFSDSLWDAYRRNFSYQGYIASVVSPLSKTIQFHFGRIR